MTARARVLTLALLAAVVAVSSALAGSKADSFTVTSSLDGKTVLPIRSHWIAKPLIDPSDGQIAEVDYFIDGFHAWTAHSAPYSYGGEGNWLITTFFKPGLHSFTVRATTTDNQVAIDKFQARVIAAPRPPAKLVGTWTRNVSAADLRKGSPGLVGGRWTITISKVGWATGPNLDFDVRYLPNGNVVMGPEVIDRPEQTGAFCGVTPLHTWKVAVSAGDKSMRLNPVGTDSCRDRVAVMQGTWTRSR